MTGVQTCALPICRWIGGKIGIYARGKSGTNGYGRFKFFKVKAVKTNERKR